uniref:Uncharacterized protein n=1 Tax=Cacopsylla melanoneura TaxID=428564 RepID=A0A8D8ZNG0_9HEMI
MDNESDDTVVKKTPTQETVKNSDGSTSVVDKTTVAAGGNLYNPHAPGFNPYAPFYNPYNQYSPYAYGNVYNPSSPYFNQYPLSPLSPLSPAFTPYTPYNPYSPLNYNSYSARAYYGILHFGLWNLEVLELVKTVQKSVKTTILLKTLT